MTTIPPEIIREIIRVAPYEAFCSFAKSCKEYLGFCKSILPMRIDEWVESRWDNNISYECLPNGFRHGLEWDNLLYKTIKLYNFGQLTLEARLDPSPVCGRSDLVRCFTPEKDRKWYICDLQEKFVELEQLQLDENSYLSIHKNNRSIKLGFGLSLDRFSYRKLYRELLSFDICKFVDEYLKYEDKDGYLVYRGNGRHLILSNDHIQVKIGGTFWEFHRNPLYYMDNEQAKEQVDKIVEESPGIAPILRTYFGPAARPSFFAILGLNSG